MNCNALISVMYLLDNTWYKLMTKQLKQYIYIYVFLNVLLRLPTPKLNRHSSRFRDWFSASPLSLKALLMLSSHVLRGLPLFLLLDGVHSHTALGNLSLFILRTCPYYTSWCRSIVCVIVFSIFIISLISVFRTLSSLDFLADFLSASISTASIFFSVRLVQPPDFWPIYNYIFHDGVINSLLCVFTGAILLAILKSSTKPNSKCVSFGPLTINSIYVQHNLDNFKNHIIFFAERQAVLNTIAWGMMGKPVNVHEGSITKLLGEEFFEKLAIST